MTGLEFVADLIETLAWPVTVVAVAWVLRDQITALIDMIGRR